MSLDHWSPEAHDRIRVFPGAFHRAVEAIEACLAAGIFTAIQAVVEPPCLEDGALERFLEFCRGLGVGDVMLLEPFPVGDRGPARAAGAETRSRLASLQLRSARDPLLPRVSSMSLLESPEFLGCQAGFTFLHVATGGEVFPCDFAPASFGSAFEDGLEPILDRLKLLRGPSRRCLALWLRERGLAGEGPFPWTRTRSALEGYDPGEPPGLMRFLARRGRAVSNGVPR